MCAYFSGSWVSWILLVMWLPYVITLFIMLMNVLLTDRYKTVRASEDLSLPTAILIDLGRGLIYDVKRFFRRD